MAARRRSNGKKWMTPFPTVKRLIRDLVKIAIRRGWQLNDLVFALRQEWDAQGGEEA